MFPLVPLGLLQPPWDVEEIGYFDEEVMMSSVSIFMKGPLRNVYGSTRPQFPMITREELRSQAKEKWYDQIPLPSECRNFHDSEP